MIAERIFVHFLGYSSTEGGVQEIHTPDNFTIGELDLETGQRDFDDFSFKVPHSAIFKVRPENNSPYLLLTDMTKTTNQVELEGITAITQGIGLWIENEKVTVGTNVSGNVWNITRAVNGSIAIKHLSVQTPGGSKSLLTISRQRISPIGLIVKVYNSEKVFAYGQITEIKSINSGSVEVNCKSLYKQVETSIATAEGDDCTLSQFITKAYNEFFALLQYSDEIIPNPAKTEIIDNLKVVKNPKDFFEQILNIANAFLFFDQIDGKYKISTLDRVPLLLDIETKLLQDCISVQNGVLELSLAAPVSSIKIKAQDWDKIISLADSNFTNSYTGSKEIELDISEIDLPLTYDSEEKIRNLAYYKMFALNSIIEYLKFSTDRYNPQFTVGKYYKFIDIYKFSSFSDNIRNNVYLCIGFTENQASFVRTDLFSAKQVAPSFVFAKSDTQTYTLQNAEFFSDYVRSRYDSLNSLQLLRNKYTGDLVFEIGDKFVLIDTAGDFTETTITDVGSDYVETVGDIGNVGDFFIGTIELWKGGSIATKNEVYLYDTNTEVL